MAASQGSTLIPSIRYRDAPAAIDWLVQVFGFARHAVHEGPNGTIDHGQLTLGGGMLMLGSEKSDDKFDRQLIPLSETSRRETIGLYLVVDDCDAVCARARAAGAEILQDVVNMDYGGKAFTCRDLEGHIWSLGSYDPWAPQKASHE